MTLKLFFDLLLFRKRPMLVDKLPELYAEIERVVKEHIEAHRLKQQS